MANILENWKKKYEKWSNLEKILIMLLVFFAILAIILFVLVLINKNHGDNICTTPACIAAAHHILQTMDFTLDPCEDFYKFSCGNVLRHTFYRNQPTLMHELNELKKQQARQMVFLDIENEDKLPKSFQYVRKFYRLCHNTTAIDKDKDKAFVDSLGRVIGGWPLANGHAMHFDWQEVMIKARKEGMRTDLFLDLDYFIAENESQVYLEISPPNNYEKEHWSEDKADYYVKIASIWGRDVLGARSEMLKTMEFAKKLDIISEKSINATKNSTIEHQKLTIRELQNTIKNVPIVSWLDFLKNMTNISNLTDETVVIVKVTQEYFRELSLLISLTENRFKANYVAAHQLLYAHEFFSKEVRNLAKKIVGLPRKHTDRKMTCAEFAIRHFHGALEGAYIRKVVTPEKRTDIQEMIDNIKDKLEISVNRTHWIDSKSKSRLSSFLRNMTSGIGWTDAVFNEKKFDEMLHMDKLQINFSEPVVTVFYKISNFRRDIRYGYIGHYQDSLEMEVNDPKLDVNAYFIKLMNILILTAPLLQAPMYDVNRPKYMNYGSLGSIIGHELTHAVTHTYAFDKEIEKYTHGSVLKIWTNNTKENFENISQCLIDEYDNYDSDLQIFDKLKGNETLEENVADLTGIEVAYEAYQSYVSKHGHEKLLPGVSYSPNQIYWIMSALYVCLDDKLLEEKSCKDMSHGEASFRTNGPIRNSPHFAKDFGCPIGSKMNPRDKCRIYS